MFGSEALEVLKQVYEIAMIIKQHVETVQANKEQCKRLSERIQIVVSAARGLEQLQDSEHYLKGLQSLKSCLERSVNFINKFKASSKWYQYLLKTNSYAEEFQDLTGTLEKSANLLQLGLNAQAVFNREKDKEDQKQDLTYIQANQQKIIELNQEEIKLLQKLDLNQNAQQMVIQQQFESLKEQLERLTLSPSMARPKELIDSKLVIAFHSLLIDKQLVVGSFANIYQGRWENSDVAIKTLEGHFTQEEQERFVREVDIMSRLRHPNIVQLYGACLEKNRACLVMPYYTYQDLQHYLQTHKISLQQQKQLALDIAKGLQYLHNQKILHRNLKSSSVLINKNGEAHLTGLGLCKIEAKSVKTAALKFYNEPYWLAPESFQRDYVADEAGDVYSYAVILWEILTGKHPKEVLENNSPVFIKELNTGNRLPISNTLPEVFQKLLKASFGEAKGRPTLSYMIEQIEAYQPQIALTAKGYYEQGLKFEEQKNYVEAFKQYKESSEKGHFKAHANYATFFLQGLSGVPQNKAKAAELFENGAKLGHVRAMMNLAMMKEYGDGIPKDIQGALEWYKKAADLGDKKAQEKVNKLMQQSQAPNYQNNLASTSFHK